MVTADIRTAAQRQCVNCGKAYVPTSDTQKFCESMCKRENYMKRRYGEEYAAEWRRYKELSAAWFTLKPARAIPTREQIAEVVRLADGEWNLREGTDREDPRTHGTAIADAILALMQELAEGENDG